MVAARPAQPPTLAAVSGPEPDAPSTPEPGAGSGTDEAPQSHAFAQIVVWQELFYDLVFVAAILVFSTAVSHQADAWRVVWLVTVFVALWWIWFSTTLYMNRYRSHDVVHRILLLAQMLVVAFVALEAGAGVRRDENYLGATFSLLLLLLAGMYWHASRTADGDRPFARNMAMLHGGAGLLMAVSVPCSEAAQLVLTAVAFGIMLVPAVVRAARPDDFPPVDQHHLVDRMGEFTIIVCGESFVKVAIVSSTAMQGINAVMLAFQFVLTFAVWASYFEDIPHAGLDDRRLGPWVALHLLAQLCIAGVAIVVSKLVDFGLLTHVQDVEILEVALLLAGFYLAIGGVGWCTRRRPVRPLLVLRLGTAAVVLVLGVLAWAVPFVHLTETVVILTVVAIVHAFLVARFRARTEVLPEGELGIDLAPAG
jgi:low temperature requirement protein LtrA